MQAIHFINIALLAGAAAVLIWAAITDIRSRRIPNPLSLTIMVLFGLFAVLQLFSGTDWQTALLWPLVSALLVFAVGIALFAASLMGGGDVKLMSAVALFAGPDFSLSFILYVTLAGGLVALMTLLHAKLKDADPKAAKVPYGVAITIGGLWVCFQRFSLL